MKNPIVATLFEAGQGVYKSFWLASFRPIGYLN
jgi:hypothetical protein